MLQFQAGLSALARVVLVDHRLEVLHGGVGMEVGIPPQFLAGHSRTVLEDGPGLTIFRITIPYPQHWRVSPHMPEQTRFRGLKRSPSSVTTPRGSCIGSKGHQAAEFCSMRSPNPYDSAGDAFNSLEVSKVLASHPSFGLSGFSTRRSAHCHLAWVVGLEMWCFRRCLLGSSLA